MTSSMGRGGNGLIILPSIGGHNLTDTSTSTNDNQAMLPSFTKSNTLNPHARGQRKQIPSSWLLPSPKPPAMPTLNLKRQEAPIVVKRSTSKAGTYLSKTMPVSTRRVPSLPFDTFEEMQKPLPPPSIAREDHDVEKSFPSFSGGMWVSPSVKSVDVMQASAIDQKYLYDLKVGGGGGGGEGTEGITATEQQVEGGASSSSSYDKHQTNNKSSRPLQARSASDSSQNEFEWQRLRTNELHANHISNNANGSPSRCQNQTCQGIAARLQRNNQVLQRQLNELTAGLNAAHQAMQASSRTTEPPAGEGGAWGGSRVEQLQSQVNAAMLEMHVLRRHANLRTYLDSDVELLHAKVENFHIDRQAMQAATQKAEEDSEAKSKQLHQCHAEIASLTATNDANVFALKDGSLIQQELRNSLAAANKELASSHEEVGRLQEGMKALKQKELQTSTTLKAVEVEMEGQLQLTKTFADKNTVLTQNVQLLQKKVHDLQQAAALTDAHALEQKTAEIKEAARVRGVLEKDLKKLLDTLSAMEKGQAEEKEKMRTHLYKVDEERENWRKKYVETDARLNNFLAAEKTRIAAEQSESSPVESGKNNNNNNQKGEEGSARLRPVQGGNESRHTPLTDGSMNAAGAGGEEETKIAPALPDPPKISTTKRKSLLLKESLTNSPSAFLQDSSSIDLMRNDSTGGASSASIPSAASSAFSVPQVDTAELQAELMELEELLADTTSEMEELRKELAESRAETAVSNRLLAENQAAAAATAAATASTEKTKAANAAGANDDDDNKHGSSAHFRQSVSTEELIKANAAKVVLEVEAKELMVRVEELEAKEKRAHNSMSDMKRTHAIILQDKTALEQSCSTYSKEVAELKKQLRAAVQAQASSELLCKNLEVDLQLGTASLSSVKLEVETLTAKVGALSVERDHLLAQVSQVQIVLDRVMTESTALKGTLAEMEEHVELVEADAANKTQLSSQGMAELTEAKAALAKLSVRESELLRKYNDTHILHMKCPTVIKQLEQQISELESSLQRSDAGNEDLREEFMQAKGKLSISLIAERCRLQEREEITVKLAAVQESLTVMSSKFEHLTMEHQGCPLKFSEHEEKSRALINNLESRLAKQKSKLTTMQMQMATKAINNSQAATTLSNMLSQQAENEQKLQEREETIAELQATVKEQLKLISKIQNAGQTSEL